MFPGP
jgi:hypothetical protein